MDEWSYHSHDPRSRYVPKSYVSGPVSVAHGNQNLYGNAGSFLSSGFWDDFLALRTIPQIRKSVISGRSSIDDAIESSEAIGLAVGHSLNNWPQAESLVCPKGEFHIAVDYIIRRPLDTMRFVESTTGDGIAAVSVGLELKRGEKFHKFRGDVTLTSLVWVDRHDFARELGAISDNCIVGPYVWAAASLDPKPGFGRLQKVLASYIQDYLVPKLQA